MLINPTDYNKTTIMLARNVEYNLAKYKKLAAKKKQPAMELMSLEGMLKATLMGCGDLLTVSDSEPLLLELQQKRAKSREPWEHIICRFFLDFRWNK